MTIVGVYAPTAQSPDDRESFFDTLRSQFTREALHLIIVGDFNSRLNSKRMSRAALHAKAQFEDFLMASDLCVSGPSQPTFFSNNGTSATLDYVVCKKRFKSSVFSVRVKNNAPLKSDHCPVVAEIYLHFSKPEMIELAQKHDFASLSDDVTRLTFVNDVGHPSAYQQFCTNFHNACEKLPRVRPQAQRRTWNTELSCRLAEMDKQLPQHRTTIT